MTVSFLRETFQVYLGRSHFILRMGRLEYVGRFLFLLRLLVDHRFRRHRARWQNLRGPGSRFILHLLLHVSNAWWVATDLTVLSDLTFNVSNSLQRSIFQPSFFSLSSSLIFNEMHSLSLRSNFSFFFFLIIYP